MTWRFAALAFLTLPASAGQIEPGALSVLPAADVIFLGEVHDNPLHHTHQLQAMLGIQPSAVVFEMITRAQADSLPAPLPAEPELRAHLDWDTSGWPDFAMYYPLFAAIPDAAIYGAALPRDDARAAMNSPLADIFPGDATRFGLDVALPPEEQAAREDLQATAHCNALPDTMLPGMVMIQRLRDAMLAEAALRAHTDTGGPVVVITGTGHARTDWGAPAALALAASDLRVLSIGQLESAPDDPAPFDLWIVTAPHPRPDPCEAFR